VSGSSPADIKINGNFTVNLTAPTAGTTKGIAFFEDRVACVSCGNKVNGGSSQSITWVIYFPNNKITMPAALGGGPICTKLVANTRSSTIPAWAENSLYDFYQFARHEWLVDIEIAAADEDSTFVLSHRFRGDRDDRDHSGHLVGLELAHDFEPRDVGKPYVQNNHIGMVLAC
jgi:hypothetical protein